MWQLSLIVPRAAVPLCEDVLAEHCLAVSQRLTDDGHITLLGLTAGPPAAELAVALALAAAAAGIAAPEIAIEPVGERNWLAENQESFTPFRVRRFFIHQQDDPTPAPADAVALAVDAGLAFGSGRHASTAGCLLALDTLHRRLPAGPVLDLGCGSAILAIAAARVLRRPVVASDIDPVAVRIAAENAQRNGVGAWIRTVTADGCAHPLIRTHAPYALIFANILARPLQRLARATVGHTAPGGTVILAGFIVGDARRVLAVYHALGCRLQRQIVIDGWATLVLRRSCAAD